MHSSTSSSDPARNWSTVRSFLRALLWVAVPGFVTAEIGFRLAGISYPELGYPDRERGWKLRPGAHGWIKGENPEGVYVTINRDGLRDREHELAKKPGVFRVAVLGNSYTEALVVPLEKTYWAVAQRQMNECRPPGIGEVEFINFGVGGYGPAQELITLRSQVWKYRPDAILLAMVPTHDIRYCHRQLSGQALSPYFVRRPDGRLALDNSFQSLVNTGRIKAIRSQVEDEVRTYQVLNHLRIGSRQKVFDILQGLKGAAQGGSRRSGELEVRGVDRVFVPPVDPVWRESWDVFEGILGLLREETARQGVPLWTTVLSDSPQVYPDPREREQLARTLGVPDLLYPNRRIGEITEKLGFPLVPLTPDLARLADERRIFLHGFADHQGHGHWNETGNRLAGELLGRGLCGLWPKERR